MARKLSNKTNVTAPDATYPYGKVKDNPGDNTGTPVNEALLGDMTQFFEKLMAATATAFNNQPENDVSGFQFYTALVAAIRATIASETQQGTVERATQAELNALTDTTRYITPALISSAVSIIKTVAIQDLAVSTAKLAALSVTNAKMAADSVTNDNIADDSISIGKLSNHVVRGYEDDFSTNLRISIIKIPIGNWNMDSTPELVVDISGSIGNNTSILGILDVIIFRDVVNDPESLMTIDALTIQGFYQLVPNEMEVKLIRRTGGYFDSTAYDNPSFNRGHILLLYEQ